MPTPFSKIDDMFLSDISDDTLLDYTEEERENILDSLRVKAITRFKACKQDLSDRDEVNRVFNQDLSDEVCLIISTIMRKFWLNDKIYNLELLRQRMSTKDLKLTSQANHLQILTELKQELDKEISRMIIEYTVYAYKADE
jgi:hypothetical protein